MLVAVSFLTDFADQAVMLPLALAVTVLLAGSGWWRGTLVWIASVGVTFGIIGLGKLVLAACGPLQMGDALQSPSGHTASATIVYGGLCGLVLRWARPEHRRTPMIAALVIAVLIGITRVALQAHTWSEVVVGGLTGCAGVWLLLTLAGPPPRHLRPLRLAAIAVIVIGLTHGTHLRAEAHIQDAGRRLAWLLPGCAEAAAPAQARP